MSNEKGSERYHIPQPEPDPARGSESQRQAVPGRPSQWSFVYPALRRFTIALWRLYATAEELETTYDYRH
jgi:hypothetical protein